MGRSGTSALTRVISFLGAGLPRNLVAPGPANRMGFWEAEDALTLNDEFLARHQSSWFDPTLALSAKRLPPDEVGELQVRIQRFLEGGFDNAETVVLKEPRIYGLFEHWLAAAASLGLRASVAHVFRHPDEVHASLQARDGLAREHSLLLWLKYNLLVERHTRHLPRIFISYRQLTADPLAAAQKVAALPGLGLNLSPDAEQAITDFVSSELHHHRAWGSLDDPTPGRWVAKTYPALEAAAAGGAVDMHRLDEVFAEYAAYDALFRSAWISFGRSPKGRGSRKPAAAE